jgi:hypothetical protein
MKRKRCIVIAQVLELFNPIMRYASFKNFTAELKKITMPDSIEREPYVTGQLTPAKKTAPMKGMLLAVIQVFQALLCNAILNNKHFNMN